MVGCVLGAFPLRHPVGCVCEPVGSYPQSCRSSARIKGTRLCETHGVEVVERGIGVAHFGHEVARAFVGSEVVVEAVPCRLADARLLGSASPMGDVVSRPEHAERSVVVGIDLGGVVRHGLRHPPDGRVGSAEEVVPQHHVGRQFRVVPCKSPYVVHPLAAMRVETVHDVTVVPKSVPSIAFDCLLIEIHEEGETLLHEASPLRVGVR